MAYRHSFDKVHEQNYKNITLEGKLKKEEVKKN